MQVIYSDQPIKNLDTTFSIFLLGPSPRQSGVLSWRPEALEILKRLKFSGIVLVPECANGKWKNNYDDQIEWEFEGLEGCSIIAAWMPRKLPLMPGFTSNFEIGRYIDSGRFLYGRPEDAEKTRYIDFMYRKMTSFEPFSTLANLLGRAALEQTLRNN